MLNELKRCGLIVLSIASFSGCTYFENTDDTALSVAINDTALLDVQLCRTYGFRNWSLQRAEGSVTLSAEASMPTPAWSIELHQSASAGNDTIELIMETIEPSGMSASVVSWISFEKTVNTDVSTAVAVSVKCAGEVIWHS